VPQDNKLTRATVADNIRFFREGFSDEAVELAARRAHLHEDVLRLPDRYDTLVGPGERSLSGGQAQRLGIARALLAQPKLLILDEPTSALDARSEELIRQTLEELRGSTTLVLIAHRPATLEVCDAVLRIEQGRVTAEQLTPVRSLDRDTATEASPPVGDAATDGARTDGHTDGHTDGRAEGTDGAAGARQRRPPVWGQGRLPDDATTLAPRSGAGPTMTTSNTSNTSNTNDLGRAVFRRSGGRTSTQVVVYELWFWFEALLG
jgi:ABC-type multidrug transport system ATPase subunit